MSIKNDILKFSVIIKYDILIFAVIKNLLNKTKTYIQYSLQITVNITDSIVMRNIYINQLLTDNYQHHQIQHLNVQPIVPLPIIPV